MKVELLATKRLVCRNGGLYEPGLGYSREDTEAKPLLWWDAEDGEEVELVTWRLVRDSGHVTRYQELVPALSDDRRGNRL